MGAWNFTIRKAGFAVANEMILSGKLYTAEQLHQCRLVDMVVDDGCGEEAIEEAMRAVHPRLRGTLSALQARSIAAPVTYQSLMDIVDRWTINSLNLTDRDLRLMERLARAQARKGTRGVDDGAVEEIKRVELDRAWGEERTGITEWASL